MILFRPGSHLATLIILLSVTGEFPASSLHLLGNERVFKALVHELTTPQVFHNSETGEKLKARLLTVSGKKPNRTIRFCKYGLPVLAWAGTLDFYLANFNDHCFSGSVSHVERNHRVAESVAMFVRAEIEPYPYRLPVLQLTRIQQTVQRPSFYVSRELKKVNQLEIKKTMFTRLTGAFFSPGCCYAVYNTRDAVMKWNGMGEFKAQNSLLELGRVNSAVSTVDSAILFGGSYEIAYRTLAASAEIKRSEFRFDSIYRHIFFIPLNEFGMRQLKILKISDWNEQLLELLFEPETRSYNKGNFEYDAFVDGVHILSFLDADIARLTRFKGASLDPRRSYEVVCYPEQVEFLRSYLGPHIRIKTIEISLVEQALDL